MSRTVRGEKAAGHDYWSRRPASGRGTGPAVKNTCHRAERQQGQAEVRKRVEEVLHEPAD